MRLRALLALRDETVADIDGRRAVVLKGLDGTKHLTFDGQTVDLFSMR